MQNTEKNITPQSILWRLSTTLIPLSEFEEPNNISYENRTGVGHGLEKFDLEFIKTAPSFVGHWIEYNLTKILVEQLECDVSKKETIEKLRARLELYKQEIFNHLPIECVEDSLFDSPQEALYATQEPWELHREFTAPSEVQEYQGRQTREEWLIERLEEELEEIPDEACWQGGNQEDNAARDIEDCWKPSELYDGQFQSMNYNSFRSDPQKFYQEMVDEINKNIENAVQAAYGLQDTIGLELTIPAIIGLVPTLKESQERPLFDYDRQTSTVYHLIKLGQLVSENKLVRALGTLTKVPYVNGLGLVLDDKGYIKPGTHIDKVQDTEHAS